MASWDRQNERNLFALPDFGTINFVQAGVCVLVGDGHDAQTVAQVERGNPQPGTMNKDQSATRFLVDQRGGNRAQFDDNIRRLPTFSKWRVVYTHP